MKWTRGIQQRLASSAGISKQYMCDIAKERKIPSPGVAAKLAEAAEREGVELSISDILYPKGCNALDPSIAGFKKFLGLKDSSPLTYEIVIYHLANEKESYEDIGTQFHCTKQNVGYHLHKAAKVWPAFRKLTGEN